MNPATFPASYRDDLMAPIPAPYFDDPEKGRETPVNPPAYGAAEEQPSPPTDDRVERKKACKRRFWRFFGYSVLVFGVLHLVMHKKHKFKHGFHQRPWFGKDSEEYHARYKPSMCAEDLAWVEDPQGSFEFPYRAHAQLSLPVAADELSFIAEGLHAHGSIDISQTADAGENAVVDVEVEYRQPEALDAATVCHTHPGDNKYGLGIFTPDYKHPHNERQLRFHINVRLPSSDDLVINDLRTYLPLFVHHVGDLEDTVYFEKLTLNTAHTPITVDSLAGSRIRAHSKNSAIRGKFNTSTELELETANAPINVHANLASGDDEEPTRLVLRTSNGHIDSEVTLQSTTASSTGGTFDVSARTSNAPLTLAVVDAPVEHALTLKARTSNSPARVTLHPTYEGAFDVQSSKWFRPTVEWDAEAHDPAGKDRRRSVQVKRVRGESVKGSAAWEEGGEERGEVEVDTSNSPLWLKL
ncbi:hypothetical protein GSI_04426 [Ganoderma sinense ZZ0214-1]|uniref:DUF7330 domain-containing protein n=1 Tax=Ganoderma sinense ZZ0214-1 TaxID=1077348 RepID=A0A2G8SJ73_9APHY|nr:hypothetical protein GSI_04426 [Ganoderma sinense ZZ0214-1]